MTEDEFHQRVAEIRERHSSVVPRDMRFEVDAGWLPLIDETLGRLGDFLKLEGAIGIVRVRQVKEKLGALRIYARPDHGRSWPDSTSRGTRAILFEAQDRSALLCEVCGHPGQIEIIDYYHQCLCPRHASRKREWAVAGKPDVDWR